MNENSQIVTAYERSNMTPEEISASLDLDVAAVKTVLSTESTKYKKAINGDVTEDEAEEMLDIIKAIAREQRMERPQVALKAAVYLYSENKGRNDPRELLKGMAQTGISITVINSRVNGMKEARARTLKLKQQTVDVESRELQVA